MNHYKRRLIQVGKTTLFNLLPARDVNRKTILFVSGVGRSGTNMMMDCFEKSLETDVFEEDDRRAFSDYRLRGLDVIDALVSRSPMRFVVFKPLLDAHLVGDLLDRYPRCFAIWMYRHYDDVVNSHLVRWPGMRGYIDEIVGGGEGTWHGKSMTESTRQILKDAYRDDLNDASAVALLWYYRNALFFDMGLDADTRSNLVKYEDYVVDPGGILDGVCDSVGMKSTWFMKSDVHAGSIRKNRPPEIADHIRILCDDMLGKLDKVFADRRAKA